MPTKNKIAVSVCGVLLNSIRSWLAYKIEQTNNRCTLCANHSHSSHENASTFRRFRIQCEPSVRVKLSPHKNPKWLVHTFLSKLSWDTFLSAPTTQISFGFWSSTSRWSRLSSLALTKTTENALIRLHFSKLNIFFCPHILSVFDSSYTYQTMNILKCPRVTRKVSMSRLRYSVID